MSEYGSCRDGRGPITDFSGTLSDQSEWYRQQFFNPSIIGMANDRDRPMRDYVVFNPQTVQTCIVRPELNTNHFEFKPIMFQMLQTIGQFSGAPIEDPHLHLKQFLEVCSNFLIPGVSENAFRLKLFPYSLKDGAKAWLMSLEPNSIHTWNEMAEKFLTKYFPPIKNARMRNEITSFRQKEFETLFEAWERWKELLRKCPHHGIPYAIQLETFYNGLEPQARLILDASSGGVLLNLSYNEGCELIESIATNSCQWPTEKVSAQKNIVGVHEISQVTALSAQIASLTNMLKNISTPNATASMTAPAATTPEVITSVSKQAPSGSISCVFCGGGHLYEKCPSNPTSINHLGYNNNNTLYSNAYNSGWEDHPNFKCSNNFATTIPTPPPEFPSQYVQRPPAPVIDNSMEALLKEFMGKTDASIKNLENQVGQLATALYQRPSGLLSSTTEASQIYGQEQVNAISSRSGTEYPEPTMPEVNKVPAKEKEKEKEKSKDVEKEKDIPDVEMSDPDVITSSSEPVIKTVPKLVPEYPPPPYPQRLKQAHESKQLGKFLDVLKQLHINIPLLEALQQIPNYARFMKDVLTKKRRLREFETVEMTGECSMIMQNKIPMKLKDPGSFTIPCSIGKSYSSRALCDLGASINLMPKSIFKKLGIGTVRPTTVTLRLADRSIAYPEGIIEDVLIKVDKFVFPVDFVVLDFNADKEVPIILGRPFLATAQTLIDVQKGELTMRVNDQEIKFNVMKTLKSPDAGTEECSFVMSLDSVTQNHFYKEGDHLVKALANTEKEKLVEEVVLQGEDDVNESSKESEGGKDGSEKEEIAMEIEPEPGPKTTLNQQKGPSPLTPPYKNPPPQSPPKQPIPLPLPPKITKCTQVIAEIKQPETTQISQQSKPKVKEDLVVASSATASDATDAITSTTQVNEGATVVDMFDEATGEAFKINGQGVKLYSGAHVERDKVIKEFPKL